MTYFEGATMRWDKLKPKCKGCVYLGYGIPCEYILVTGKSPQSQGAHIDPEGDGGCELKETKQWKRRKAPQPMPMGKPDKCEKPAKPQKTAKTVKPKKKRSKLDTPEIMALYEAGKTDGEIAEASGMTIGSVWYWRKARGLSTKYSRKKQ